MANSLRGEVLKLYKNVSNYVANFIEMLLDMDCLEIYNLSF
ncbi:LOW QUALITY PROTEIN: ETFRF1 isoform 9 [Pongo abelii]|uniref:ETFRF1 isoform 5 n=1 Tax=Pongo abelii TaxID=9601 RepID=A0A2J8R5N5_PONAB|nr:LOW QUALITY PROTEIN: ETFRF1 isoform 5 [Pongo abelii]PNJ03844.1 LOW QUALITY PROTEIN: ETFRF1 isoform 9 [Pongo abelii]